MKLEQRLINKVIDDTRELHDLAWGLDGSQDLELDVIKMESLGNQISMALDDLMGFLYMAEETIDGQHLTTTPFD